MANRSRVIALSVNDLKELERLVRASSTPAGLSRRARAILLMSEGLSGVEVADKTGYTDVQVSRIRRRFAEEGMAGLHERARSGRPPFDYTAQTRSLVESEYRSVFLKRFPRYAGRARRGATVAGDHLRGTAVVVENAPKLLSRHDGASVIRACRQRCEELVAETLVVPFCVIVHYVFGYRCAQVSLTERYEAVETLLDVWRERIFPHMRSDSDY